MCRTNAADHSGDHIGTDHGIGWFRYDTGRIFVDAGDDGAAPHWRSDRVLPRVDDTQGDPPIMQ